MADIVLKDRNGKDVTYSGIETVTFDTPTEGKQATFTEGVAVDGLEIVPDFSGGDMAVIAPDGMLVKSATIKKPDDLAPENIRNGFTVGGISGSFIGDTEEQTVPLAMADGDMVIEPSDVGKVLSKVIIQMPETLVPENIAEGVDIGGVIGEFAGGGAKVAMGSFTGNRGSVTVEHNLGVVPDIIYVTAKRIVNSGKVYYIDHLIGFSSDFKALSGLEYTVDGMYSYSSSSTSIINSKYSTATPITGTIGSGISSVNETSFVVGSSSRVTENTTYLWVAVGGLI